MTWFAPAAGPTRDQLTTTIDRLAAELDAPRFQPHVTVLVTFEAAEDAAVSTLASFVADVPPFNLTFTAIRHEETYFRSLYLQAAPSAQLQALQEAGQRAFALDRLPPTPHLSPLYSGITGHRKRPLISNLGISLPLTACFDAVEQWGRDPQGISSMIRNMRGMTSTAINNGDTVTGTWPPVTSLRMTGGATASVRPVMVLAAAGSLVTVPAPWRPLWRALGPGGKFGG